MDAAPLADKIREALDRMPAQLQAAGRFVLSRPREVALLSMRDQARQAGVQPATMTRFAKRLGLAGYDAIRNAYADALRGPGAGFSARAGQQVASQKLKGEPALAADIVNSIREQIGRLTHSDSLADIVAAAKLVASARRVYCLGLRSSYPVAWHAQYVLSLLGKQAVMLDAIAGTGVDPLRLATVADILVVVSVKPYTQATIQIAEYAVSRKLPLVAITDSAASPLAKIAKVSVLTETESSSFFHTMAPAFVAVEILVALVAGRRGQKGLEALKLAEQQFAELGVHANSRRAGNAE